MGEAYFLRFTFRFSWSWLFSWRFQDRMLLKVILEKNTVKLVKYSIADPDLVGYGLFCSDHYRSFSFLKSNENRNKSIFY